MIVHDRRLLNDPSLSADDRGERPSLAILQAALEIGREGREWLGDRLVEDRAEHADLQSEVDRLASALSGRESAITALSEQATAAAKLNSQLSRQISVLWEERERLLQFLDDASKERTQLAGTLYETREAANDATRTIDQLVRERDVLAAEVEALRNGGAADQAIPAGDMLELGRSVELISAAIGEIRRLAQDARTSARMELAGASVAGLDPHTQRRLDALTALPELQSEVGRIGERVDALVRSLTDLLDAQQAHPHHPRRNGLHLVGAPAAGAPHRRPTRSLQPARLDGRTRPLLTLQAVERALARALPAVGLPREVVSPLLSAWLAGAIPLVSGRDALTSLQVCGRVLAADQVVVVPVDARFNYPEQLLMHPGGGSAVTADGSELLDLLAHAHSADGRERLSLVVFEGVNQTSVERVLLPLLQVIANRNDPAAGHTLGQLLPDGLDEDGPYAALAGAPWPSNVLVAATIADGEQTQPLPSALWARAAYLCLDHLPTTQIVALPSDSDPASQMALTQRVSFVPSELWDGWTAETRDEAEMTACVSGDIEILDSRRDVVATWRMIEAALAVIGRCHPTERTSSVLLHHAVVPWAVSAGLDREAAQLVQSQTADVPAMAAEASPRPCCGCLERAIRGAH